MTRIRSHISISLDGYVAGPNQSTDDPLGRGGERLHEWALATRRWQEEHGHDGGVENADSAVLADITDGIGAYVMGRRMFGGGEGPWDGSWTGWWGDEPPFRTAVFVVTHHGRGPLEMAGGTTFAFVTEGVGAAIEQARAAAGERDVMVAGGASTIAQCLAAGLLDELYLHIVPVVLGGGARLLADAGDPALEPVDVVASPAVTHVRYRVT